MTRGRFWLRVFVFVAIACGFAGERIAHATGMIPNGWGWSMTADLASAVVGWLAFVIVLTKTGR